jgi:glycosyltransferase involved in cell wall biosynthesis
VISVITINYNNATGLEKTISSVLKQTDRAFSYIVIDGGSSDGSVEIIRRHAAEINWWVSEKDNGIYDAMNKGTRAVKDGYCYYLNSGDVFYDNTVIEKLRSAMDNSDLIGGQVELLSLSGEKKLWRTKSLYRVSEIAYGHLPHQGFFYHRRLFDRFGFYDDRLRIVSDWAFLLDLVIANVSIRHTSLIFATHVLDGVSTDTSHAALQTRERQQVLERHATLLEDLNELYGTRNLLRYFVHRLKASLKYRLNKSKEPGF